MTVNLINVFLVGDVLKSTLHLYNPSSDSRTFTTDNPEGSLNRKFALAPKILSSDQYTPLDSGTFPRASKLKY